MVIFHSYVSLTEGKLPKNPGETAAFVEPSWDFAEPQRR